MSINTAHANGGVLIFNGEIILLYCDGVELIVEGISSKEFAGTKKGRIYLTTHRMIFLNKNEKDDLQSFSFPFFSMTGLELEQPIFGANFIKGTVKAQVGGNWSGNATFKLKFFSGGAIEFGQAMLQAARMANQYMPPQPPPYTPHQGPYYPAPPPAYSAPMGGINGFMPPTHAFPNAPPANSVYTSDMPPPYPGIYLPSAYPPGTQMYQGPTAGPAPPAAGPPPPGFSSQGAQGAPPPGYPGVPPAGAYPPPYYPQGTPGAPVHYSANTQEPQNSDPNKASAPPLYPYYQDPYNQHVAYSNMNGNVQGPPPPYYTEVKEDSEDQKKKK